MSQNVKICPIMQWWRIRQKLPRYGSRSGWLPKFNSIFLLQEYIFGKFSQTSDQRSL